MTRKTVNLRKTEVNINKKIQKLVTKIHKRRVSIKKIHKKLIVAQTIVSSANHCKPVVPAVKKYHWTHKMFRCTVWKQPQVIGPIAGPGLSKAMNLEILISKEQQYLAVLKKQTAALEATIKRHQNALNAEKN